MTTISETFAARVRELRTAQGLSQPDVTATLREQHGLTWAQSTLSKVEHGTRAVTLEEAVHLSQALGYALHDVLLGIAWEDTERRLRMHLHNREQDLALAIRLRDDARAELEAMQGRAHREPTP